MFLNLLLLTAALAAVECQTVVNVDVTVPASGSVVFSSPGFPGPLENNTILIYNIVGPANRAIEFTVVALNLGCSGEALIFNETFRGSAHQIQRFYQSNPPGVAQSKTNQAQVFLHKGPYVQCNPTGFNATAKSIYAVALPTFKIDLTTSQEVVLSSPSYPSHSQLEHDVDAQYIVTAPSGHVIQFDILDIDLGNRGEKMTFSEHHPYLGMSAFADAQTALKLKTFRSHTSTAEIHFLKKRIYPGRGFSLTVKSILVPDTTVFDIRVPANGEVSFTSPGFPVRYEMNANVNYTIIAPPGYIIEFKPAYFDVLEVDKLTFTEEIEDKGPVFIGRFATVIGGLSPFRSSTNSVNANFDTTGFKPTTGFNITATAILAKSLPPAQTVQVVIPSSGVTSFTSPGYPSHYGNNINVQYSITTTPGHVIQFNVVDFGEDKQGRDYLNLTEIVGDKGEVQLGTYNFYHSGRRPIQSTTNAVTVVFKTDAYLTGPGFNITATSLVPQVKQLEINVEVLESGLEFVTSPNYPLEYENNLSVKYTITAPPGHIIEVQPLSGMFAIELHDSLVFTETVPGHGEVAFGGFIANRPSCRGQCGISYKPIRSVTNHISAYFKADFIDTYSGFKIPVKSLLPDGKAEFNELVMIPGSGETYLTSPGFPKKYGTQLDLNYFITVPEDHIIQFNAVVFNLGTVLAAGDSFTLSELIPGQGRVTIGTFKGTEGPMNLKSATNNVLASFKTDNWPESQAPGFDIKLTSLQVKQMVIPF